MCKIKFFINYLLSYDAVYIIIIAQYVIFLKRFVFIGF